jgi:hypothetical protein
MLSRSSLICLEECICALSPTPGEVGDDYIQDALPLVGKFARQNCWALCRTLANDKKSDIIKELEAFSFNHVGGFGRFEVRDFHSFLVWLAKQSTVSLQR